MIDSPKPIAGSYIKKKNLEPLHSRFPPAIEAVAADAASLAYFAWPAASSCMGGSEVLRGSEVLGIPKIFMFFFQMFHEINWNQPSSYWGTPIIPTEDLCGPRLGSSFPHFRKIQGDAK